MKPKRRIDTSTRIGSQLGDRLPVDHSHSSGHFRFKKRLKLTHLTYLSSVGSNFYSWEFHELLAAQRLGAFHKESGIIDVDFDDKNYIAHKFIDCLPPTFTVGKKVNGKVIATHKIFYRKSRDVKVKNYGYPKTAAKGGKVIEILANTQTIIAGIDRVIVNDVMPMVIDPSSLELETRLIVAFSELYTLVKDIQNRNDFYFKLGGALARETDVPMDLRIKYVKKLCELTNDDEVNN